MFIIVMFRQQNRGIQRYRIILLRKYYNVNTLISKIKTGNAKLLTEKTALKSRQDNNTGTESLSENIS